MSNPSRESTNWYCERGCGTVLHSGNAKNHKCGGIPSREEVEAAIAKEIEENNESHWMEWESRHYNQFGPYWKQANRILKALFEEFHEIKDGPNSEPAKMLMIVQVTAYAMTAATPLYKEKP